MPGDTGQGRSWRREAGGDLSVPACFAAGEGCTFIHLDWQERSSIVKSQYFSYSNCYFSPFYEGTSQTCQSRERRVMKCRVPTVRLRRKARPALAHASACRLRGRRARQHLSEPHRSGVELASLILPSLHSLPPSPGSNPRSTRRQPGGDEKTASVEIPNWLKGREGKPSEPGGGEEARSPNLVPGGSTWGLRQQGWGLQGWGAGQGRAALRGRT